MPVIKQAAQRGSANQANSHNRFSSFAERYALVALLLALIIFFSVNGNTGPFFSSSSNLRSLAANLAVTGILAMGMVIPLVAGYFDLSISAIAGASSITVAAMLCNYHSPVWLAVTVGVLIGPILGMCTAFLVTILKLNPMIASLGVYILISGFLLAYTQGGVISSGFPTWLSDWGVGSSLGLPHAFLIFIFLAFVCWYVIDLTPYGRKLTAIGSSDRAARLAGIPLDRVVLISFLLSGFFGGVAGVLLTIQTGSADATTGISYLFPALTVIFLGQTAIKPGRVNVWGTVTATALAAVAVNGLTLLGAQSWVQQVFNGGVLIISLTVSVMIARARERRAGQLLLAGILANAPSDSLKEESDETTIVHANP